MTIEPAGDSAELRKARGAFFTPPEVTHYLAAWSIRAASDRVLEPSCGDGAILDAVVSRLDALGEARTVTAYELHEASAEAARQLLAAHGHRGEIRTGDFLATTAEPSFDVAVGNPPYIRYQGFTGEARARGMAAALAQGVRLSRLSSSWAPFVVHTAGHLKPGGRLALVLPAELLSSNYAGEVRDFLLRRFRAIDVVLFGRHVFPGVQTEALLLLAEGQGGTRTVRFASVDHVSQLGEARFDTVLQVGPGDRWNSALVSTEATGLLRELSDRSHLVALSAWGRVSLGAVTGNNKYFTLTPDQVREHGLSTRDVVAISPPGSSHLRALAFTQADHAALGRDGRPTYLFRPETPTPAARAYIVQGAAAGVPDAYKCRVRTPWWRTPLPAPPDLFFTYMNEQTPQLAANVAQVHHLNSVHGLYLHDDDKSMAELLALAALNSATALSAELTGRAYGGGILKMEPREAAKLLVPSPEAVRTHQHQLTRLLPDARRLLQAGRLADIREAVDDILLRPAEGMSAHGLGEVREALGILRQRRRTRARSRSGGGKA